MHINDLNKEHASNESVCKLYKHTLCTICIKGSGSGFSHYKTTCVHVHDVI